jgi:hypothetical protein
MCSATTALRQFATSRSPYAVTLAVDDGMVDGAAKAIHHQLQPRQQGIPYLGLEGSGALRLHTVRRIDGALEDIDSSFLGSLLLAKILPRFRRRQRGRFKVLPAWGRSPAPPRQPAFRRVIPHCSGAYNGPHPPTGQSSLPWKVRVVTSTREFSGTKRRGRGMPERLSIGRLLAPAPRCKLCARPRVRGRADAFRVGVAVFSAILAA